jgi:hypothetical protein
VPAYQTSNFSYQGAGQFAYQEGVEKPKPFGRHPPRGLSRAQLQNLEAEWLNRKWLRHPTIEVPEATPLPVPIAGATYEVWGLSILGLASDAGVSMRVSVEPDTLLGIGNAHQIGIEIEPPRTDHELNLGAAFNVSSDTTHSGSPHLGFTTRSDVQSDLYLERPISADEIAAALSRLRKPRT